MLYVQLALLLLLLFLWCRPKGMDSYNKLRWPLLLHQCVCQCVRVCACSCANVSPIYSYFYTFNFGFLTLPKKCIKLRKNK